MNKKQYTANSIGILKFPESVREKVSMYVGSKTSKGLHHLFYEVIDNAIDEHIAGYCTRIDVKILPDEIISVQDNGRGIPVDIHPKAKLPALEVVMTTLHAGGKFNKDSYEQGTSGLHGVGVSCVNALSTSLTATVYRNGKIYQQSYKKGVTATPVKKMGDTELTGTHIVFQPDPSIFETTLFNYSIIADRLRELSFLNPGLKITLVDERTVNEQDSYTTETFFAEKGLEEFVLYLDSAREAILPNPISVKSHKNGILINAAITYNSGHKENIYSYANNIKTFEGGTHLVGLKKGVTRAIKSYGDQQGFFEKVKITPSGDDFREGSTIVVSVRLPDPQFSGQEKARLTNSEISSIVESAVSDTLKEYLEENPKQAKVVINKVILAAQARKAAKRARDLIQSKNTLQVGSLPGKFADCSEKKDPRKRELFILEGNSAGGNAKQARQRNTQAILPLRGKILNAEKSQEYKIYENEEMRNIISVLGVTFEDTEEGRVLNMEKLRYHKIIIMTDADQDGHHIQTLLLTFFFRYMPEIIKKGYLYVGLPPLFLVHKGTIKRYCWNEKERDKAIEELKDIKVKGNNTIYKDRYKGLGEMNADQLWGTCFNPDTRKLKNVIMYSELETDQLVLALMGNDVRARKLLIEEHSAEYIDAAG